ncbi:hypothetical protein IFM89_021017 [Coptis chinensis]|uniref:Protein kinase domain-containing protein n=1 Tax=Coptis chinensis TaxID=261450 RepID=A0A835LN10_9MAGN|nr:hypothetical protein IFM89_021017 [Coptis chinensis]
MFQLLLLLSFIVISLNKILPVSSMVCPYDSIIEYPGLMMKCLDNRPLINISNQLYLVQEISYYSKVVTIVDADIEGQDCPQPRRNFSLSDSTPYLSYDDFHNAIFFYNCTNNNPNYSVAQLLPCLDNYNNSNTNERSYAFDQDSIPEGFDGYRTCSEKSGGRCLYNTATSVPRCVCDFFNLEDRVCPFRVSTGVGGLVLLTLLVIYRKIISSLCSRGRNKTETLINVEEFLQSYGCRALQRYKYSSVKKMTNSFKDTLGKGGYGCVFKGKLRDGRLVAVKVLNESKGNGEDFVNEVATIGGTNHVNVVSLLGFCAEKTKRALVYEFMPNGSLERFIYHEKESSTMPILGWEKLYQIALGIARGLEYLHRGCNTRILHFDIKPHNILLDEDLCPKISDFGMAKLCPTRDISVVSMVGARGTIGYIAPEVCCRNFGGCLTSRRVYSYGMMVLEMIGGRKNIDVAVENMSEIYFPQWIYNHLKPDFNVEGSCEIFEEETTKRMIVVALWCIQTHPTDRPSMTKVVDMLEGNNEDLKMPPNPFLHPPSQSSISSS